MAINDFKSKLWDWLINRSPKDAARPDVQPQPANNVVNRVQPAGAQRIETNIETQSILGLLLRLAVIDSVSRTPDGELVSGHDDETVVLLGCGHFGTLCQRADQKKNNIKQIAGRCYRCGADLEEILLSGAQMDLLGLLHAELKTLVCETCGKITTSGLACPKHYTKATNPDGTESYLDVQQSQQMERQNMIKEVLGPIAAFLSENTPETLPAKQKEQNNA
jgi:hypothetical protein